MISNKYYSGFCLENEKELFKDYLIENDFTISGFSFGAIKAFEEVYNTNERVDKLQLFSPAFFQDQDNSFIRMQLMFFKKNRKLYCDNFLENISHPTNKDTTSFFKEGTYEELELLLTYKWNSQKLQELVNRGVKIEVYLGDSDKIINSKKVKEFFTKYATVYYIKNKGHIL